MNTPSPPSREWLIALQQVTSILSKSLADVSAVFTTLLSGERSGVGVAEGRGQVSVSSPPLPPTIAPVEAADLIPLEDAAREFGISPTSIYGLMNKGLVQKYKQGGRRNPFVSRGELSKTVHLVRARRSQMPPNCVSPIEASGLLGVSVVHFYNLVKKDLFTGVIRNPQNSRIAVPLEAIDAYKKKYPSPQYVAPVAQTSLPIGIEIGGETAPGVPDAITPSEPTINDHYATILSALEEEVQQLESYLGPMAPAHQQAQLAVWAGTARKVAADDAVQMKTRTRAWDIINMLRPIAERYGAWVNALYGDWEIEDWNTYVKANAVSGRPQMSAEEEEVLAEAELRGIVTKTRRMETARAQEVIERCRKTLGDEHSLVLKATRIYSIPKISKEESAAPAELPSDVPAGVLALTKGKRVLIVGGQGDRSESCREFVKQLQLESCEWITHERSKNAQVLRVKNRISPRNFDMMLYLKHFTGHVANALVTTAKKTRLPVVNVARGYSVTSIASAIGEQYNPVGPLANGGTRLRASVRRTSR